MAWADFIVSYLADSFLTNIDFKHLTTLEARVCSRILKKQDLQATRSGVWMLVSITGGGMCISTQR
jgi:hypothetical protein